MPKSHTHIFSFHWSQRGWPAPNTAHRLAAAAAASPETLLELWSHRLYQTYQSRIYIVTRSATELCAHCLRSAEPENGLE